MRITDLLSIGKEYLLLGVLLAIVLIAVGMIKKKKISANLLVKGAFACYIVIVVGATLLSRTSYMEGGKIMPLFYSYKEAWVNFSVTAWRNIVLNICMFVPFGILLPVCVKLCRTWWRTYLAGLAFTIAIESVQLLTGRGIFELDDVMGNTAGAIIGYGCFALGICILKMWKKEKISKILWKKAAAFQVPLVMTVLCFGGVFYAYHKQELGNIPMQCIVPYDVEKLSIHTDVTFSDEVAEVPVYQCDMLSREDTVALANQVLSKLGTQVDNEQNDFYEETAVLRASERYHVWVSYAGGTYELTDYDTMFPEKPLVIERNASEEELREAFEAYGTEVPKDAELSWDEDAENYCFFVDQKIGDACWKKGEIRGTYYENGCFSEVRNSIVEYETYKKFLIISEKEAYEKLEKGEFNFLSDEKLEIEVLGCELEYRMDSKGFYQPVYVFNSIINQVEYKIEIAAIKNGRM